MPTRSRLIAAAVLAAPLALLGLGNAMAQTANTEAAASIDSLCDHCADYTDAANSAGPQASAYRPLAGYAAEPMKQADTEKNREQEMMAMRTRVPKPSDTE